MSINRMALFFPVSYVYKSLRRSLSTTTSRANTDPSSLRNIPSKGKPICVPGFGGCPVEYDSPGYDSEQFDHGANSWQQDPRLTARELAMLRVMDALTDKPDWHLKLRDPDIFAKWRAEAMQMPLMSERTWDWIAKEMHDKAVFHGQHGFVTTLESGSPCAKADRLITQELKSELRANVLPLLQAREKDWHPGSNEKVLNLCHPSLFPLVYGRTKVLEDHTIGLGDCFDYCGQGVIAPVQEDIDQSSFRESRAYSFYNLREPDLRFSGKYQWLPAEVKFRKDAESCAQLASYINNLDPSKHRQLYGTIEELISKAIPMWNSVLVTGREGRCPPRIKVAGVKYEPKDHPDWPDFNWDAVEDGDQASLQKVRDYLALPDDPEYDTSTDSDLDEDFLNDTWVRNGRHISEAIEWKFNRIRRIFHPEPGIGYTYDEWKHGKGKDQSMYHGIYSRNWHENLEHNDFPVGSRFVRTDMNHEYPDVQLERDFREEGLQVIVKLSSVELTPEKPSYDGGSWHIEGLRNERIVGTAIYYYDVDNVTDSRIRFRQEAKLDNMMLDYEQSDFRPLETVFAAETLSQGAAIQEVGSISTPEGRMIAFPNTLQHCVEPFELKDKTRPGHRRILVLWLVDPHYRILSTANVPPQQHEWWAERTSGQLAGSKLPRELADVVAEHAADFPMSLEEAKRFRLELMEERTKHQGTIERGLSEYNFCEH